jgi:hypothetical protein
VLDGGKVVPGISTHPLGGRVGGSQARKSLLQGKQSAEESVILAIGDLGAGLYIVEVVVPLDGAAKALGLGLRLSPGQSLDRSV